METKTLVVRTWDDLVFAYRNQEYGAYPIRKAYSGRLMLGFGISTALIAGLILFLQLAPGKKIIKAIPPLIDEGIIYIHQPPVVEPKSIPKAPAKPMRATPDSRNIRIVSEPVETPVASDPVVASDVPGTDTGTEIPLQGTVTGLSDIPVVAVSKPEILITAEVMPSYDGGLEAMMKFIKTKIRYPAGPRRIGVEGTVYVSFVVNGDGSVSQLSVLRGIAVECDEEAMRVISMLPGWRGGRQNGSPVAVRMVLPIKFSLAK